MTLYETGFIPESWNIFNIGWLFRALFLRAIRQPAFKEKKPLSEVFQIVTQPYGAHGIEKQIHPVYEARFRCAHSANFHFHISREGCIDIFALFKFCNVSRPNPAIRDNSGKPVFSAYSPMTQK